MLRKIKFIVTIIKSIKFLIELQNNNYILLFGNYYLFILCLTTNNALN